ncbi:Mitochondrial carrier family [Thalictrum thalictroides]|uniref:Mitochondrial carrier family n=1 Tax=Thalictrum thalictroides TaxID=46969 RepID=A0A7J6W4F9_THATH|nr:Mitochondrial carrier family [Thalictrum thalictroides]
MADECSTKADIEKPLLVPLKGDAKPVDEPVKRWFVSIKEIPYWYVISMAAAVLLHFSLTNTILTGFSKDQRMLALACFTFSYLIILALLYLEVWVAQHMRSRTTQLHKEFASMIKISAEFVMTVGVYALLVWNSDGKGNTELNTELLLGSAMLYISTVMGFVFDLGARDMYATFTAVCQTYAICVIFLGYITLGKKMGEKKPNTSSVWYTVKPFINGGASGMLATCVIQPIDMVKVRIQLGQGSAVQVSRNMIRNEGVGALYKGLSAGLLRQATYTTARLGSFRILTNKALAANDGKPLPLYQKALCGLTAGAIGASIGSPADLALIRMQADATLPAAQRRNYTNAFNALYRIIQDEGVLALWKGAGPTVVRAMGLNMGMLASYDQSVEFFRDNLGFGEASTIVGASAVSGFFASACSLPFDYVKTQIQKMQPDASGKYPYTGSLDCVMKTLKSGGPLKFYTGFPVYCIRIAPHVMMTWIFLNQIQKLEEAIGL